MAEIFSLIGSLFASVSSSILAKLHKAGPFKHSSRESKKSNYFKIR